MTTDDLVLVRPDGAVEGGGHINMAAYYLHALLHEARAEVVSAAHCHTPYGTPFSASVTKLEPISQRRARSSVLTRSSTTKRSTSGTTDGGKRIAVVGQQTVGCSRGRPRQIEMHDCGCHTGDFGVIASRCDPGDLNAHDVHAGELPKHAQQLARSARPPRACRGEGVRL
jgi:hypothetical protein